MLCRGVLSRLANEATKQSTIDVTQVTRQIRRVHLSSNVANLARASRIVLIPLSRSYATTTSLPHRGRPKKGSPGEKAAKTRSRATRAKAPATKKAAPKRKSASGRKAAPKRKAAAPKKKAAPKRKVLTEAQQKRAADKKKTLETRELKETALLGKEPKKKPYTAWTVFASENIPKGTASGNLGGLMKENAAKYRDLSAAEMEVCSVLSDSLN